MDAGSAGTPEATPDLANRASGGASNSQACWEMQSFFHDVRFALRTLARNRRFSIVAILTLGLGLGAAVAIFSVVQGVLLRSLPYQDPDRLVFISQTDGPGSRPFPISSPGHFRDYREQARQFESFAAGSSFVQTLDSLSGAVEAEQVDASIVTANFFPLLGVSPSGRNFLPEEEVVNGPRVAIIGYDLWRRRYAADPKLVGTPIRMNGQDFTVVGILPPGFKLYLPSDRLFLRNAEVWLPAQIDYAAAAARRQAGFLCVIGKLKKGVSIASAQAEMDRIAENFRRNYQVDKLADLRVKVVSMLDLVVQHVRPALLTIMAVVALVLIIACANVANLCLARGTERQKEIAIRTALGASRMRVVRQILTECLVLSFLGLVVGLLIATIGLRVLWVLRPPNLPRLENIQLDGTALAFAIGTTVFTALLFGLLPALASSPETLKERGRGTTGGVRRSVRSALIVGEIAVSLVVLVTAGLLLRSFAALERVETGFTRGNVFTFQVALPFSRYNNPASVDRFFKNLEDQLRALPGVQAAGAINLLPLGSTSNPFGWASEAAPDQWAAQAADTRIVTPQYFSTMGIKLLSGRVFTEQDDLSRSYEVVVDDVLARRAWPGASALGQKVNMTTFHMNGPPTKEWWHVIGVVQHVHNESLTEEGMLQIYRPLLQDFNLNMTMVVRSEIEPVGMQKAAESILRTLDKDVPLHQAQTIDGYIKIAQTPMAFNLILIGAFGLIALVLASVGLYGVIAYLVSQRTREIGVRIALGAQRHQILRLILGYGLKLTAAGLASGVLISLAVSQVISNQLFEVKATDLATYILTPAVLAFVAMLASYFPSRRAARLDPMDALRYDGQ